MFIQCTREHKSVSRNTLLLVVPAHDEDDVRENGVVEQEGQSLLDVHLGRLPIVETQVSVPVSLRRQVALRNRVLVRLARAVVKRVSEKKDSKSLLALTGLVYLSCYGS